jgi:CRP-like cAMP-binding protein
MISLLAVMSDGQAIETATIGSEGVVGAMAGFDRRVAFARAVVQAPMHAARVTAKKLQSVVRNGNGIRQLLVRYNEVLLAQVQQTAACNALHPMEARLARWLLQTRDRVESNALPLTQEFLSQMLGVRRTTVNLIARQLENAGVILNRRGRIVITDRNGLEELACECYGAVRDQLAAELPRIAP